MTGYQSHTTFSLCVNVSELKPVYMFVVLGKLVERNQSDANLNVCRIIYH